MRIITGLQAHQKIQKLAKEVVGTNCTVITETPLYVEDMLLKEQSVLFDQSVQTLSQFEQSILYQKHAFDRHLIQRSHLIFFLRNALKSVPIECFSADKTSYALIDELIKTLRQVHQNNLDLNIMTEDVLRTSKFGDLKRLNNWISDAIDPNEYWCLEEAIEDLIDDDLILPSLYILADDYTTIRQSQLFQQLDTITDVTLLMTTDDPDNELCRRYQASFEDWSFPESSYDSLVCHHLWELEDYPIDVCANLIVGGHVVQEAQKVAAHIKETLLNTNAHYSDFMIITAQNDYTYYFKRIFDEWSIPTHLNYIISYKYDVSYQRIVKALSCMPVRCLSDIVDELLALDLTEDYRSILTTMILPGEMDGDEFKDFLDAVLQDHTLSPSPHDAIDIVPLGHACSAKAKHVYMVGMNESLFPKPIKDGIILNDRDLSCFDPQPLTLIEQMKQQECQVMKAFQVPQRSLTLSYSRNDMTNSPLLPSTTLKHLEKSFVIHEPVIHLTAWKPELYLSGSRIPDDPINDHLCAYDSVNKPVQIDDSHRQQLGKGMSISRLETYNRCPFQYFVKYGLKIEAVKEDVMVTEFGTLAHEIIEKCLERPDQIETVANEHIEAHLKDKLIDHPVNAFLIDEVVRTMSTNIQIANDQLTMGDFKVYGKEVQVKGDISDIPIMGYVDRVDIYNDTIRVIDYKSGHKDIDPVLVAQGFNMQMLVYLELLSKQIGKQKGAIHYFSFHKEVIDGKPNLDVTDIYKKHKMTGYVIDDDMHTMITATGQPELTIGAKLKKNGEPMGKVLTQELYDDIITRLKAHLDTLYDNITQGMIPILPSKGVKDSMDKTVYPCKFCDYKDVCQFDVFYNKNRKIEEIELGGDTDDDEI